MNRPGVRPRLIGLSCAAMDNLELVVIAASKSGRIAAFNEVPDHPENSVRSGRVSAERLSRSEGDLQRRLLFAMPRVVILPASVAS